MKEHKKMSNGADARWRNETEYLKTQIDNDQSYLFQQKNKKNIALYFIIPSFVILFMMITSVILGAFLSEDKDISQFLEFFLAVAGMLNAAFGFILAHYFRKD